MNSDGEVFGAARLMEAVKCRRRESLDDLLHSLMGELQDWRGDADLKNDVSILACEVS